MLRLNLRSKLLLCNVLSSYEQLLSQFLLFSGLLTSPKSANLKFLNSEITISFPVPKIRFMRNWKSKELFKGVLSVVKILRILSKYIHFICEHMTIFQVKQNVFPTAKNMDLFENKNLFECLRRLFSWVFFHKIIHYAACTVYLATFTGLKVLHKV